MRLTKVDGIYHTNEKAEENSETIGKLKNKPKQLQRKE